MHIINAEFERLDEMAVTIPEPASVLDVGQGAVHEARRGERTSRGRRVDRRAATSPAPWGTASTDTERSVAVYLRHVRLFANRSCDKMHHRRLGYR